MGRTPDLIPTTTGLQRASFVSRQRCFVSPWSEWSFSPSRNRLECRIQHDACYCALINSPIRLPVFPGSAGGVWDGSQGCRWFGRLRLQLGLDL